jgi:hypothetical protein
MKLYATTTSERASKGQGGNEYLQIEITDDKKNILGILNIKPAPDGAIHVLPVMQASFDSRYVLVKSIDSKYKFSKHKQDTPLEARQERDSEKIKQIIESLDKKGKQKKDELYTCEQCGKLKLSSPCNECIQ